MTSATITEPTSDAIVDGRYVILSIDGHAGAEITTYRDYLSSKYHAEFDEWVQDLREPVRRSARRDRVPQLGLGAPARGDEPRRPRRRVAVPQHHPAVLPVEQPHRAPAQGRRARAALGGPEGAQPLARRVLRRRAGPARRDGADPAPRRRRRRGGDPLGARRPTSSAACCSPASHPTAASRRSSTRRTNRSGPPAPSSTCRSTTTPRTRAPTTDRSPRPGGCSSSKPASSPTARCGC